MSVCVVGRGKVGRALYRALLEAGVATTLVPGQRFRAPRKLHKSYVLAVPDARILPLAEQLAQALPRPVPAGTVALHCAGARSLSELAPLAARGVHVAVFHPLVSFAPGVRNASLRGATFTAFGDDRALLTARRLARKLGARTFILPTSGAPDRASTYHAAAALVANGAAALVHQAMYMLRSVGFAQRDGERALAGLLASVARNVEAVGVPSALTGPVVRGDVATLERHLAALARSDKKRMHFYRDVQPLIIETAEAAGLDAKRARALLRVLRAHGKQ